MTARFQVIFVTLLTGILGLSVAFGSVPTAEVIFLNNEDSSNFICKIPTHIYYSGGSNEQEAICDMQIDGKDVCGTASVSVYPNFTGLNSRTVFLDVHVFPSKCSLIRNGSPIANIIPTSSSVTLFEPNLPDQLIMNTTSAPRRYAGVGFLLPTEKIAVSAHISGLK